MRNLKNIKKICIIAPYEAGGTIGDIVMFTPVLKAIRENYKDSYIALLLISKFPNHPGKELFRDYPFFDELLFFDKSEERKIGKIKWYLKVGNVVKEKKFDLIIDCQQEGIRSIIITILSRAKYRLGRVEFPARGLFYNIKAKPSYPFLQHLFSRFKIIPEPIKHMIDHYLEIIEPLGINYEKKMVLFELPEGKEFVKRFFKENNLQEKDLIIGFYPGGPQWDGRAWLEEEFAKLGNELIKKYSAKIIIFGTNNNLNRISKISDLMKIKPITDYGKTTIRELTGLLSNLKLLISVDGGVYHMAVALGIPTVAIFGPTTPFVFGHFDEKNKIVHKHIEDIECNKTRWCDTSKCRKDRQCMKSITYLDVLPIVEELINVLY